MKLQVPFVQLPLLFDAKALAEEIAALPETFWKPHPQGYPGNSMLPLVAVNGEPDNENFAGAMRPTPYLARCPYIMQVLHSLGVTLGRTRLMRLSGHAEVRLHVDQGYYWTERTRVHVPIVTQPSVRFFCGDADVNMGAGECWIFDTWRPHRVLNDDTHARVHLVVDTVGGERFWDMVAHGRAHDAPGLQLPQRILPSSEAPPELYYESVNVPPVMSPWELRAHVSLLLAEANPHAQLAAAQQLVQSFCNRWQELWARFGDSPEGRSLYRSALEDFLEQFRPMAAQIVLRNQITLASAFMTMISKFAVMADESGVQHDGIGATDLVDRA